MGRQSCEARNITIVSGHVHVSCPLELAPSKIAQYANGRSSRLFQQEFPHLRKRYWGKHLWARGYFCPSIGKITEKVIAAYFEQQEKAPGKDVFKLSDEESASAETTDFQS